MLFRDWTSIEMKLTCKKLDKNLKNWVRFWNLKIWQDWDFATTPVTKIHVTRSIFEIEGSSFGFSLIFVCSQTPILNLKVSDLIFHTPLPKGGRIKNLKILWIWDFATTWLTKMAIARSIFEIEGSSFRLFLIFMYEIIFSNLGSKTKSQIFSFF